MGESRITTIDGTLLSDENIQNANALLALLHGKSDSICRLFPKKIVVGKSDLSTLDQLMVEKLSLHDVKAITTSMDITFRDKRILTFKSWRDFEQYDFTIVNSSTKSIYIQWDFFIQIAGYEVPQRHTVGIRIASSPDPGDYFKALLSGAFDEAHDIDIQNSTMLCKVDFINNTLAEELMNVAEHWNTLCDADKNKGKFHTFFYKNRVKLARLSETIFVFSLSFLLVMLLRGFVRNGRSNTIDYTSLLLSPLIVLPVVNFVDGTGHSIGQMIYNAFERLMQTHVFELSKGDEKENERVKKKSSFAKGVALFILNIVASIAVSLVFFLLK